MCKSSLIHLFQLLALIKATEWLFHRERERVLGFICYGRWDPLARALVQSMAFPVPWRDRSVDGAVWALMGLHVCMCVRTGGSYSLRGAQRRKQPQTLINCNQSIYLMQDLFLLCRHTPSIWMWCQSVLEIVSTNLLLSFQIIYVYVNNYIYSLNIEILFLVWWNLFLNITLNKHLFI